MLISHRARTFCRRIAGLAAVVGMIAWLLGCGDDIPTGLGNGVRTPPDSLRIVELRGIQTDSVYAVPVSLGRATSGSIGRQPPYTAHILYEFHIPTRVVDGSDTLHLDEAHLIIKGDSIITSPFTGAMRLGVQEVAADGRDWSSEANLDSAILVLPPLEPDALTRDVVLVDTEIDSTRLKIDFPLDLTRIAGYDTTRAQGGTLVVNIALLFRGFDTPGAGLLPLPYQDQLVGFSNDRPGDVAITTVNATRHRMVAEIDSTYSPGTKLAVSDGYRMHSFIKFDSVQTVVPESALIHLAELVLTQVDLLDGTSFGAGPALGVTVPLDTMPYSQINNLRTANFAGPLAPLPGGEVTVSITTYIFDQQERNVPNRGMILRLPLEGTALRHFEFYGAGAPDSLRPRIRIVYGFPAAFEGGKR